MQFLIVFISYLVNTQHVSSDIRSSSGVLFTVHTASGYLCCYLSVALSCVNWLLVACLSVLISLSGISVWCPGIF
jgi:hypothetical protein